MISFLDYSYYYLIYGKPINLRFSLENDDLMCLNLAMFSKYLKSNKNQSWLTVCGKNTHSRIFYFLNYYYYFCLKSFWDWIECEILYWRLYLLKCWFSSACLCFSLIPWLWCQSLGRGHVGVNIQIMVEEILDGLSCLLEMNLQAL